MGQLIQQTSIMSEEKPKVRKIVFLTGTRADFGKLKSLIEITSISKKFEVNIFVTGMHMSAKYGSTFDELLKCGYKNIYLYRNQSDSDPMDMILSRTITGFSQYIRDLQPDMIVIHGDRVETLAGAIVGVLNDILTVHIEGGEVSGTVDELIRHAVSKMCHIHFVSNNNAKQRLIQMGEEHNSIFVIGSPDIDILLSNKLPDIEFIKTHYDIGFDNYSILIFHPVVSEYDQIQYQVKNLVNAIINSNKNYITVYPNNDKGTEKIFLEYKRFKGNKKIKIFPSLRFEYFLVLLKNAKYIIGNSSSGIRESPYYGVPTVNIGTRQMNRSSNKDLINCSYEEKAISDAIKKASIIKIKKKIRHYGDGNSDQLFLNILNSKRIWKIKKQKHFKDILPQ